MKDPLDIFQIKCILESDTQCKKKHEDDPIFETVRREMAHCTPKNFPSFIEVAKCFHKWFRSVEKH
jgi:hypothetical protein